jgi:hypothetical protein
VGGPNGAAVRLGVKRPTLMYRMKRLQIERPIRSLAPLKLPQTNSEHFQEYDQAAVGFGY